MNMNKNEALSKEKQLVAETPLIESLPVSQINLTDIDPKIGHNRMPKDEMADAIPPKRKRIGAVRTKTGTSRDDFGDGNQAKKWVK